MALPVSRSRASKSSHNRFLLLSATSIQAVDRQETLSRVERLSTLTGGRNVAVVFLLSETSSSSTNIDGMHAYIELELLSVFTLAEAPHTIIAADAGAVCSLFNMPTSIPILPLHDVTLLPTTLLSYQNSSTAASLSVPPLNTATTLLPHCTTSAPQVLLSEHSTNVLTDICSTLEDLVTAARTEEGQMHIKEYLDDGQERGAADAEGVIHFWEEEWIAE